MKRAVTGTLVFVISFCVVLGYLEFKTWQEDAIKSRHDATLLKASNDSLLQHIEKLEKLNEKIENALNNLDLQNYKIDKLNRELINARDYAKKTDEAYKRFLSTVIPDASIKLYQKARDSCANIQNEIPCDSRQASGRNPAS